MAHKKKLKPHNSEEASRFKIRMSAQFVLRLALGCFFVISGFAKLIEPYENFLAVVEAYEIAPDHIERWIAFVVPWLEFILGVFVIMGLWLQLSLLVLWAMVSCFIGIVASAIMRSLPITDCGCFGDWISIPPKALVVMDSFIWSAFAWVLYGFPKTSRYSLDEFFKNRHP